MAEWTEARPPVPDWDRDVRARNKFNQLRKEKPGALWAGAALILTGLVLSIGALQYELGMWTVVREFPLFFVGCLVALAGLGVLAFTLRPLLD